MLDEKAAFLAHRALSGLLKKRIRKIMLYTSFKEDTQ